MHPHDIGSDGFIVSVHYVATVLQSENDLNYTTSVVAMFTYLVNF